MFKLATRDPEQRPRETKATSKGKLTFFTSGVGKTLPLSCFESERERTQFAKDYPSIVSDQFDNSLDQLWERAGALADACSHKAENADLVGTAFVARDMMRVVDALGEDGLLRYYGDNCSIILL